MADYYPLLTRALEALPDTSADTRRTVYERARKALVGQLRSLTPPLAEPDIERERRALEEAIGRIEGEHGGVPEESSDAVAAPVPAPAYPTRSEPRPVKPSAGPTRSALPPAPGLGADGAALSHPEPDPPSSLRLPKKLPRRAAEPRATAEEGVEASSVSGRDRPRIETVGPAFARDPSRRRSVILGTVLLLVVAAIAVTAWLLRDDPNDLPQTAAAEGPVAESQGKLADRVGGERPGSSSAANSAASAGVSATGATSPGRADVAVAPRAVLFEENPADQQNPKSITGRVVWRLDGVNAGQGQPLETVVRATIEVPDSPLTLNLTLRRNLDAALPASHTVELVFNAGPDRSVRDVGLLQLKPEENVRGTPVSGLPVPVKDNLFLIGLSNLKSDVDRNVDLLLHRDWIDLPLKFSDNRRAVLSFEKGLSGERVLTDAFAQWQ